MVKWSCMMIVDDDDHMYIHTYIKQSEEEYLTSFEREQTKVKKERKNEENLIRLNVYFDVRKKATLSLYFLSLETAKNSILSLFPSYLSTVRLRTVNEDYTEKQQTLINNLVLYIYIYTRLYICLSIYLMQTKENKLKNKSESRLALISWQLIVLSQSAKFQRIEFVLSGKCLSKP